MIYLDNAATSWPKAPGVAEAITRFLTDVGANPGRSGHRLSIEAARLVSTVREQTADLFGAPDPLRVVFTLNVTHAINWSCMDCCVPVTTLSHRRLNTTP